MGRNRLYLIILLILFFNIYPVFSQELLTWENCVEETGLNHPDLIAAKEKVTQAAADKNIEISSLFPQLSGQLSGKTSKSTSGNTTDTYAYSITGEQLIFDGFKTSADIKSASETLRAQQYNYNVTSSTIRLNLRTAFANLLKAQKLISLTSEIVERRKQNLELIKLRHEAGREHKGALLTAQADLAQAEFELTQAKRNLSLAQRELTKELGRKSFFPLKVEGAFDTKERGRRRPDFESLADTTPFLKELIAKKEAARFDYKSAQSDFFPQVYLNGSLGKSSSSWPPENDIWSAGLTLSFDIFEGGSKTAQVKKAGSQLREAEADERSGRDSVILTLEETWKNFQDAICTVSVKKKFLDAAQERAKIANVQYSTGLVTFDDWVIIEDNLVSAKKAYLDAQADMLVAEANWIQAKGGTLEYVQK